jgi:hypothetical protein
MKNQEPVLTFRKGLFCCFCILLWFVFWGAVSIFLTDVFNETIIFSICTVGAGFFGLVPVAFFEYERRKNNV